ncbi:MAG TPA: hypothetical protein VF765_33610 [Polyangiaceae bacterium]
MRAARRWGVLSATAGVACAAVLAVACALPREGTGLVATKDAGRGYVDGASPSDAGAGTQDGERVPGEAGPPEPIVVDSYPVRAVGISDADLVWATTGMSALHRADLDGGGARVIESLSRDISELTVAGGAIYYTNGDLHVVQLDGTADMVLLYGTANACLQVTGSLAYLVNGGHPPEIDVFDIFSGTRTPLVSAAELGAPWGVAVTASDVYWSGNQQGDPDGGIWQLALDGGGTPREIVTHLANPNCLTVHDGALWWADYDDGTIRTSDLAGGWMQVLATGQDLASHPTTVVVDARYVYWNSGKTVMRLAR